MAGASSTCSVTPILSDTEFATQTTSLPTECLAVIYFHAPWAEPCKQMSTILSTLASTYEATIPPRIAFFSLDAEEIAEISEQYDVTQVPLIVLQKNGQVVDSLTGTDAAKVRNAVEKHAGGPRANSTTNGGLPAAQAVTKPESASNGIITNDAAAEAKAQKDGGGHGLSKEDFNTRLGELVKAAPVMLFMKGTPSAPQCGFSRQTVAMLRERNIRYGFFNILADDEVRQGLKEFSEWPTFPQLYVGGEFVGGLDIVKEEFENDPEFLTEYAVQPKAS